MNAVRLRQWLQKVDALSLRERGLVFVALLAALLVIWNQFFMAPVMKRGQTALQTINAANQRIEAAEQAISAQARSLDIDGAGSLSSRIEQVRRRSLEVESLIQARAAEIVDPATMAQVLEDMLQRQDGLTLIRARNRDPERVAESTDDMPLFRHRLQLELEGPYLKVLAYLEDLEALPWRIYWQGIEIDAETHPRNRVRIEVSTLSFDEEWIGV